jgi:hypothetical protein
MKMRETIESWPTESEFATDGAQSPRYPPFLEMPGLGLMTTAMTLILIAGIASYFATPVPDRGGARPSSPVQLEQPEPKAEIQPLDPKAGFQPPNSKAGIQQSDPESPIQQPDMKGGTKAEDSK